MATTNTLYALDWQGGVNFKIHSFGVSTKTSSSYALSKTTFGGVFGPSSADFGIMVHSSSIGGFGYFYQGNGLNVYSVTGSTWNLIDNSNGCRVYPPFR